MIRRKTWLPWADRRAKPDAVLLNSFLQRALRPVPIAMALALIALLGVVATALATSGRVPAYTVVLDPGHGGTGRNQPDDKWDALSGKYLQYFAPGTLHAGKHEHKIALDLARRTEKYLAWTNSSEDWPRFTALLREFSNRSDFPRVSLITHLARRQGWDDRKLPRTHPEVNAPFRLYDFPSSKKGVMRPGRISFINALQPHLVLSIHLNPAGRGSAGGMAAVLTPGYETFNLLREIALGNKPASAFDRNPWKDCWLITDAGWSRFEAARSDTWVYFNGYRAKRNGNPWLDMFRGYRHNMVTWRYADPPEWARVARQHAAGPYALNHRDFRPTGKFWNRERGRGEYWRREGGPLGFGGDNHYASDELMRFIQYGARRMLPARRKPNAMGPILKPFVSTYSMPTYINAINAYLEIAHINRPRDISLVTDEADTVARSLAVGIYSLFAGVELRPQSGPYTPRGKALDFERYENLAGGNYFKIVVDN